MPFFCYYGGKFRSGPRYPAPDHDTIVEPFAGAAGYSTRYPEHEIILVEKDGLVAALWRYLIGVSPAEIRSLKDVPLDGSVDDLGPVCQEAKWLVGFWLNKGSAQPKQSPSSFMRSGIRPNSFWGPVIRERIASQVGRIRHWRLIEGDYTQAPDIEATWFVDPPYQRAGKYYRVNAVNYLALSQWVKSRSGLVVVCEQDGADWLQFRPFAATKSRKGASEELVYIDRSAAKRGCWHCNGPLNGNDGFCSDECVIADARAKPAQIA